MWARHSIFGFPSTPRYRILNACEATFVKRERDKHDVSTDVTREDDTSDPSRFSRESRANNEMRFTRNALSEVTVEPRPDFLQLSLGPSLNVVS